MLAGNLLAWFFCGRLAMTISLSVGVGFVLLLRMEICRRSQIAYSEVAPICRHAPAFVSILSCLKVNRPIPPMRGWAASPDFVHLIPSIQFDMKPHTILECGVGVTTPLASYAVRQPDIGNILSLEHEANSVEITRESLKTRSLENLAEVVHAPL